MLIISGGQTGVDRGALDAALELGFECGGWCPAGRVAEDGTIPERYPVVESASAKYSERTADNVANSDGTLIISKGDLTGGTHETLECCRAQAKPHLLIDTATISTEDAVASIENFILGNRIAVLNVAGPRASQWQDGHKITHQMISAVLRRLSGHKGADEYNVADSPRGEF